MFEEGKGKVDVYVTKADGSKQPYVKEKIMRTAMRLGASPQEAAQVAARIEAKLYDGISTRKILQLIFTFMRKPHPAVRHLYDLRHGISLMAPKPEFEVFVRTLLVHCGFQVQPNTVLRGLCGEHEVDALAQKDSVTYFVEVKHHENYHSQTGLDESRIARAIIEDVSEGYIRGVTDVKVDRAMIVTNTRYSFHALNYGVCRDILLVGWESPEHGIREVIEQNQLYPVSCLRDVSLQTRIRLADAGIVLIKQLLEQNPAYLERNLGLPHAEVEALLEKAHHTSRTVWRRQV